MVLFLPEPCPQWSPQTDSRCGWMCRFPSSPPLCPHSSDSQSSHRQFSPGDTQEVELAFWLNRSSLKTLNHTNAVRTSVMQSSWVTTLTTSSRGSREVHLISVYTFFPSAQAARSSTREMWYLQGGKLFHIQVSDGNTTACLGWEIKAPDGNVKNFVVHTVFRLK